MCYGWSIDGHVEVYDKPEVLKIVEEIDNHLSTEIEMRTIKRDGFLLVSLNGYTISDKLFDLEDTISKLNPYAVNVGIFYIKMKGMEKYKKYVGQKNEIKKIIQSNRIEKIKSLIKKLSPEGKEEIKSVLEQSI